MMHLTLTRFFHEKLYSLAHVLIKVKIKKPLYIKSNYTFLCENSNLMKYYLMILVIFKLY